MSNTLNRTIAQWTGSGAALLAAGYQALVAIGILAASSSLLERREIVVPIGALAGIAIVCFLRLHRTQLKAAVETEQETHHRILTIAGLSMQALREIRVLGKTETFIRMLSDEGHRRFESAKTLILLTQLPRLASELLLFTAFGAIALIYIGFHGSLSGLYPLFGMLLVATARLIPALNLVFNSAVTYRVHRVATASILDRMLNLQPANAARRGGLLPVLAVEIRFENVAFAYPQRSWRLDVRSWSIRAGTLVTIIGPSGYGKSTLLDLLCGFLTPTGGRITVDGVDLLSTSTSWQSQLAYLPQVAAMMGGTLADNIALGESPAERDATKLEWVSCQCLADVLESLPGGLLGALDERGTNLSGGQRQRVGLARALYFGRKVLVLDEPTASLDRASAQRVVDLLAGLKGTHTVIIATHDPAFERIADDTLHLDAQTDSVEGHVA